MSVDYVNAVFGGKPVRFRIGPKSLDQFEVFRGSARAALTRFLGNAWTIADLKAVLTAAHPKKFTSSPAIDAALAANRPATYVPLATTILVAALAGIDETSAVFDEAAA